VSFVLGHLSEGGCCGLGILVVVVVARSSVNRVEIELVRDSQFVRGLQRLYEVEREDS